jgi:hypothetical protein
VRLKCRSPIVIGRERFAQFVLLLALQREAHAKSIRRAQCDNAGLRIGRLLERP